MESSIVVAVVLVVVVVVCMQHFHTNSCECNEGQQNRKKGEQITNVVSSER